MNRHCLHEPTPPGWGYTVSDALSASVAWTKRTSARCPVARSGDKVYEQSQPCPRHLLHGSLDQAEQVSQGQQDRQDHQKDHEAGEEAGGTPPPPFPQPGPGWPGELTTPRR